MTLALVRHGRTAANATGLLLGRADPPLDETGERQAQALAAALVAGAGEELVVVSSPLQRATATAEVIARSAGVEVTVDDRWIELDYGALDGTPPAEVAGEVWRRWRSDPGFAPEGGESLVALGRRVRQACEELAEPAAAGTVVVVSHVSPIKAAVAWALDVGEQVAWRMHLDVAAICRVRTGGVAPVLLSFNEIGHLGP